MHKLTLPMLLLVLGAQAPESSTPAATAERPPVPIDERMAQEGRAVYERHCIACHGEEGDGRGYSAEWLDPHPRDFTGGIFKCRSTPSGTLPTDEDLLRTVRVGIYHTYMPAWRVLGDRATRAVVEYLKTFSPRWKEEAPGDPITITAEPKDDPESRKRGRQVWVQSGCEKCHGAKGKGDGASVPGLLDDWGHHLVPFDFTTSTARKCGNTPQDLYRTFMTGVYGTPMPSFADSLQPQEAWDLVHYLQTLVAKEAM
jgi:cytochrome c oxidase cbb3-type subunit 2